jgi:ubiquinone/menaquinone biosynthesis C-methylase UbiE
MVRRFSMLDVAATLARVTGASMIDGIESFQGIVGYARSHVTDPRVIFELCDAQDLSYTDESFDRCLHCRSEHTCC